MNTYVQSVLDGLKQRYAHETEFLQAAQEMLHSLSPVFDQHPEFVEANLLERFVEAERIIIFRVPWVDDKGRPQVNRAYRVQHSSAIGPYKGGMRFHPNVNLSILKFLALEQTLKNSLTGLPIGGGKGGSDFDPKGKSEQEVMRFCQSLMTELYRHIGASVDVPAGDIGVGAREVGYMMGQYKRLVNQYDGTFTGKGLTFGGSIGRTQATGYGLLYLVDAMLKANKLDIKGMKATISGSGNVAIYAAEKAAEMGAKVIAMSDSGGCVVDEQGIDLDVMKQIKFAERGRISEYPDRAGRGEFRGGADSIWRVPCDLALPCATQNELDLDSAKILVQNGVKAVAEGANMPATLDATEFFMQHKVLFVSGKAANAGGVSVSALEMSQNAMRLSWDFEEVDRQLKGIMENIFDTISKTAAQYGDPQDYVTGANIAGFLKVAEAMMGQGVV
ncbi:MAG: NADP-specific glutamate dehydrogenase [Christensenellales bacterium]|jgi:glutamate dehydrogenase (NADP+)|nr:NADP-specific glutamate dehydrogenase [Clostridiales bacterium]